MSAPRPAARVLAPIVLIGLAALTAGCISLLPKQKPDQLFRFGYPAPPVASKMQSGFSVSQAPTSFERAASGDSILTITGEEAAYIAGSRWVTSANTLFESAVARAFDADPGPARLVPHGEPAPAEYALKLDVRQFETHYDHGREAPPTVMIELYAGLVDRAPSANGHVSSRIFIAQATASENRTGAIANAYDVALGKVLSAMVAWVDNRGA